MRPVWTPRMETAGGSRGRGERRAQENRRMSFLYPPHPRTPLRFGGFPSGMELIERARAAVAPPLIVRAEEQLSLP